MEDTIYRQQAIDALWKALYEYEDKTEKQFIESGELDVSDWIAHRGFVQNMSDIDRQTILALPSAQPERKKGKWFKEHWHSDHVRQCSACHVTQTVTTYRGVVNFKFCPYCGADMRGESE